MTQKGVLELPYGFHTFVVDVIKGNLFSDVEAEANASWKPNLLTHLNCGCKICKIAKQRRKYAKRSQTDKTYATKIAEKVSFDHINYKSVKTIGKFKYSLLCHDEASNDLGTYKEKSRKTEEVERDVRHFLGKNATELQELFSDNAPEFIELGKNLRSNHTLSAPRRPTSNARTERFVEIVGDGAKCNLLQSMLGPEFLPFAIDHFSAMWLATEAHEGRGLKTPYEERHGVPFPGKLQPFGTACTYVPDGNDDKANPRGLDAVFLGYYLQPGRIFDHQYLCVDLRYFLDSNRPFQLIRTANIRFPEEADQKFPIAAELRQMQRAVDFFKANPPTPMEELTK